MVEPNLVTYGMEAIETHADVLNAICEPDPRAALFYEMMSGALV